MIQDLDRITRRLATPLAVLALVVFGAGSPGAATTPPPKAPSVKDSPGYIPLVDPESTSVLLGRRTNAPVVSVRFQGGAPSLNALGRAVIRAVNGDHRDSLMALCITESEFRDILWREFPQSRPVTGLTWEDGWRVLYSRLLNGTSGAVRDFGGHRYEFVRFQVDSSMAYKNFKLHSRLKLVTKDETGQIEEMRWVRAVAERKGSFKIYSTDD